MHTPKPPRSCVETENFATLKAQLLEEISMTDEEFDETYLLPLQDLIAWNPEVYPEVGKWRVVVTLRTSAFPSLRMGYTFDDKRIYLKYVGLTPQN